MKSWEIERAKAIQRDMSETYGRGWAHMSETQRTNAIAERVLRLLLTQDGPQFEPAQALVRKVLAQLPIE